MSLSKFAKTIAREEGSERNPAGNHVVYPCPAGKFTVGYGRNVDKVGGKGLTEDEALYLLRGDVEECVQDLAAFFGATWENLDEVRRGALVDMRFQLGPHRFRAFRKMIAAIPGALTGGDWSTVAAEAADSAWRKQTPERAVRVIGELRTGEPRPS